MGYPSKFTRGYLTGFTAPTFTGTPTFASGFTLSAGQAAFPAGTAAAPPIVIGSEQNGIYASSQSLNITANGTQRAAFAATFQSMLNSARWQNSGQTTEFPLSAQSITAVGNAITATAKTVAALTADGVYTLTSAPTIAAGNDGQILWIVNVGTNAITIQDQGTLPASNLRLAAATIAIAARQSLPLMYSTTIGDWIQIGPLVAVI